MKIVKSKISSRNNRIWALLTSSILALLTLRMFLRYSIGNFWLLLLGGIVFLITALYWAIGSVAQRDGNHRSLVKWAGWLTSMSLVAYFAFYDAVLVRKVCELFLGMMIAESVIYSSFVYIDNRSDDCKSSNEPEIAA